MTISTAVSENPRPEPSVFEAIRARRAVRSYLPNPVSEATLLTLLDAAVQAPTAMHQEPWAFVVIQDRALLRNISERAKQKMLVETSDPRSRDLAANPSFNIFYDASSLVVICAPPASTADCWLAAENLMLAAYALGLGTCPIGFAIPILNCPDVKEELSIPAGYNAIAPIIVGVPAGTPISVPRKDPHVLCWR